MSEDEELALAKSRRVPVLLVGQISSAAPCEI